MGFQPYSVSYRSSTKSRREISKNTIGYLTETHALSRCRLRPSGVGRIDRITRIFRLITSINCDSSQCSIHR
jgi:hypothetical protein